MASPWKGSVGAVRLLAILSLVALFVPVSSVSAAPRVSVDATPQPATAPAGSQVNVQVRVSNSSNDSGMVVIYSQVQDPNGSVVESQSWYRNLPGGGEVVLSYGVNLPGNAVAGTYPISVLVWGSGVYHRDFQAGELTVTGGGGGTPATPTPTATEPPAQPSATATEPPAQPTATATPAPPTATPSPTPVPPTPTPTTPSGDPTLDQMEAEFLSLLNAYRQQNGLAPLQRNSSLDQAAYDHSADMAERRYFSHYSPEGTSPWTRMREAGYTCQAYMGENIAAGYSSAQAVFNAWRNSPGHNANMLSSNFDEIGIGLAYDPSSPYRYYWTTDFGRCVG